MLTKRLIPSLLLRNGRLVKGQRLSGYRDAGNPLTTIRALCAQGADEIILLSLDKPDWHALEDAARECFVPLTYGGGLRTEEDVRRAFLCGADKVFLPHHKAGLVHQMAGKLGSQAIVMGCDATDRTEFPYCGAGEIRLLDVAHEGTRKGMDLDLIRWAARAPCPVIAEGGIGSLDHIAQAFNAGADAVALGAMLTFGDNNIVKLKRYLSAAGFCVRI